MDMAACPLARARLLFDYVEPARSEILDYLYKPISVHTYTSARLRSVEIRRAQTARNRATCTREMT